MNIFGIAILVTIFALAFVFVLQGFGLISLKFGGVKYEDAKHKMFEETKSLVRRGKGAVKAPFLPDIC